MKKSAFKSALSLALAFLLAFSVMGVAAVAANVTIVKMPAQTSYYQGIDWTYNKAGKIALVGGDFDISGTVLSYNSKTVEYAVNKWPNMYTKADSGTWTAGNNTMRIYCDNFPSSVYATLTVKLVEVESVSVVTPPKKTNLIEDEDWVMGALGDVEFTEFDLTGIKLKVKYTDGTTKSISYPDNQLIGWSVAQGVDSAEPGEATLYATFGGKRAPFTVNFLTKDTKLLGDVNGDYAINSFDALIILQSSVGKVTLDSTQTTQADVTKDGKVNSTDALTVLQYVVGKITSF
ncbi:MAG: dockerin type I repeat-containing protein [Clostridia bacterium]|nr:dockerin type I repeat-containing protein [Clostridia bacterium]